MHFIKLLSGDTEIVKHIDTEGDYVFVSESLESEGFHIQPEGVRFRHVFDYGKKDAYLQTKAPCDGDFYLALQIQDTFGTYDEEFIPVAEEKCGPFCENLIELTVENQVVGRFRYGGDDRKYYLFVTEDTVAVKKGNKICYRILQGERALFTSILMMKKRPEIQTNEILNLTTANGEVRFWTRCASKVNIILGEHIFSENQYLNNHSFVIPKEFWGIRFIIEACDEQGNILRGRATCREEYCESIKNQMVHIPLLSPERISGLTPVSGVFPFSKGSVGSINSVEIVDDSGNVYAIDKKITSKWQDGSVRTATFCAILPLDGRKFFAQSGIETDRTVNLHFFAKKEPMGVYVEANGKTYFFSDNKASILPDRELHAVLYDQEGKRFVSQGGHFQIKENGLNHIIISRVNHFMRQGQKHLKCIVNLHFYREISAYALEFAFENDKMEQEFTTISGLYLEADGVCGEVVETVQLDEQTGCVNGKHQQMRCDGRFNTGGEQVIIKDFWQNYPKSFALSDGNLRIGICPFITEPERYRDENIQLESRLFFYLKTGKYEFHCGLKKYHTILFGENAEKLQQIAFLLPPKELIEESCAFGHISCQCADFPQYDSVMADGLEKYLEHREKYREFGMLNYGDSFGEREIHWTNMEYDFPYGMLIHFLRTGDERFYRLAETAAEHYEGIDCSHRNIHFEENGYFFIHTVGHANNYYPFESLPQSFGYIKSHIGHIFVHGLTEYYKVTGIERYKEAVISCANSIAKYYTLRYDFLTEREPGWSMLALEAAYELTLDPYYLNACRIILERIYKKQDPKTGCLKYFMYIVPKEGQTGEVCYGGKSFMHGIVGSALKYFYYLTGDEKAKRAAIAIARWLADDMYDEEMNQFWYTEAFKRLNHRVVQPETNIEILDVILFACLETGNQEYLEIARKAFEHTLLSPYRRECDVAKIFSMRLRFAPEIMSDYECARKTIKNR